MNKATWTAGGLFVIAALSQAGCGAFLVRSGGVYAGTYAGTIPLTLFNDTPVAACYVRMGPSTDPNWGDDWLGETETIPPGVQRTFMIAGGPGWDIRVQTCRRTVLSEVQRLPVLGPMQLPISTLRPASYVVPQPVYATPPPVLIQ